MYWLFLLLITFVAFAWVITLLAPILNGFLAKHLATALFASRREIAEVRKNELNLLLFRLPSVSIDHQQRLVSSSILGLFKRTARYHPGSGCTLYGHHNQTPTVLKDKPAAIISCQSTNSLMNLDSGDHFWQHALRPWTESSHSHTLALSVAHHGKLVAEWYAEGIQPETPLPGWSMAKSIMNAWVGIMVRKGLIDIHQPLPREVWQGKEDGRKHITIHHLLQMSSGLSWSERYWWTSDVTRMLFSSDDVCRAISAKAYGVTPGSRWQYASGTTNVISKALRLLLGDDYHDFPYRELFAPLGMSSALLETDASGNFVGSSYMLASARDWVKFGTLYTQDGIWEGQRILPPGWVDYTRQPADAAPCREYGAHFWLNLGPQLQPQTRKMPDVPENVWYASGFGGQRIIIVPDQSLVVVRLGSAHFKEPDFNKLLASLLHQLKPEHHTRSKTDINHNM
jgi:CubicO group peptidase (beta-lactamase class C family)